MGKERNIHSIDIYETFANEVLLFCGKENRGIHTCKLQTLFKKAIKDEGGIPGLEELAVEIFMLSVLSDSWACFKALNVSLVPDETCSTSAPK